MFRLEKRAAAQKAEADFFALIKESGIGKPGAVWKEVLSKCATYTRIWSSLPVVAIGQAEDPG